MRITIADRFRPFSHVPGTCCVLPGSSLRARVFPAFVQLHDLSKPSPELVAEIKVNIKGPVRDFTVQQDLEKGRILVWGFSAEGFFRYRLQACSGQRNYAITIEKNPRGSPLLTPNSNSAAETAVSHLADSERLSLGFSKDLNWQSVRRRGSLAEILPVWFRLGRLSPKVQIGYEGTAEFLRSCRMAIGKRKADEAAMNFHSLLLAGFEGMLSPRLNDDEHQGFAIPPLSKNSSLSPLILLTEGAALIRSLFLQSEEGRIDILPALPSEFHSGRFIRLQCGAAGCLDMEWTKKTIRRMVFDAALGGEVRFHFSKDLKRFRLRTAKEARGKDVPCGEPLSILPSERYLFDNFQR